MTVNQARHRRAERGQSLVELALGFTIISTLLLAVLDLGRIYFATVALEDAAGEAALFMSIYPYCIVETDTYPDGTECGPLNNATSRARNAIGDNVIDWNRAEIEVEPARDPYTGDPIVSVGEPVIVRISYEHHLLTPLVPGWIGINPLTLTVTANQTIIRE